MAEPDMRAAKRAYTAEQLAELVHQPPAEHADTFARVGAAFHLAAYDSGIDLTDPDDAATACAVLYAVAAAHPSLYLGMQSAAMTALDQYREGIR